MIITCPNCNKQFKIDNFLIPDEGRDLQCGSCNHIWFYNIQEKNNEALELKQEIIREDIEPKDENKEDQIKKKQQTEEIIKTEINNKKKEKNFSTLTHCKSTSYGRPPWGPACARLSMVPTAGDHNWCQI